MKNQDLLLLTAAAVAAIVIYKKYTTQVSNQPMITAASQFVPVAPVTNAPAQIQQPANVQPSPITAVMPTGAMALTFDNISNF